MAASRLLLVLFRPVVNINHRVNIIQQKFQSKNHLITTLQDTDLLTHMCYIQPSIIYLGGGGDLELFNFLAETRKI